MKKTSILALGLWVLIVGGNVIHVQRIPPQTFMDAPRLPWQIVFMPIIIVFGAFFTRGLGEVFLGRWVDSRFGRATYREFMGTLRLELLFAAMCLGIVLSALARAFFFKTSIMPPEIIGFFASGSVAFLAAHYICRRD